MAQKNDATDHELMLTWVSLVHAGQWLPAQLDHALKQTLGISLAEQDLMNLLSRNGEELPMQVLAERLFLSKAGMTKMVDRLSGDGLVRRRRSAADRRVVTIALTDSGRKRLATSRQILKDWVTENVGAHLEPAQRTQLLELLRTLLAGHGRWQGQLEHLGLAEPDPDPSS